MEMEIIKCGMCGKLKLKEEMNHWLDMPLCDVKDTTFYVELVCDRCFELYVRSVVELREERKNAGF